MDRLQAMRVFVRVAELGSFTRAAAALGLSRARVSEAIGELEAALGAQLLHRTTRKVALSDGGREYYERARQILADVADAEAAFSDAPRGRLRLAMPMALARSFVVPELPRFLRAHPDLSLEVLLENRALALLEDGIDCALSYGKPRDESLVAQAVMPTHLLTCAAPSYLQKRGVPRSPADLDGHDAVAFLQLESARPAPWSFSQAGSEQKIVPRSVLGFNSMEACVEAAEAGLGVTQVLSSLAERSLAAGRLRTILADHTTPGPSIYVVYPPQRGASPRLRAVTTFLREVFSSPKPRPKVAAAKPRPGLAASRP